MSEVVTRRTLSIVLYNQHTGLQQIHATRTRTSPGTLAHNTLIPRVTNTDTRYHTVLVLKEMLDALLALEAELLAATVHRLRRTELNCHCAVPSQDLDRMCVDLLSDLALTLRRHY